MDIFLAQAQPAPTQPVHIPGLGDLPVVLVTTVLTLVAGGIGALVMHVLTNRSNAQLKQIEQGHKVELTRVETDHKIELARVDADHKSRLATQEAEATRAANTLKADLDRKNTELTEARARTVRINELCLALYGEITADIQRRDSELSQEQLDRLFAMIDEDPSWRPFITYDEAQYFVFRQVEKDFSLLPAQVIIEVVKYYQSARLEIAAMAKLDSERFAVLKSLRKKHQLGALRDLDIETRTAANAALAKLEPFAKLAQSHAATPVRADAANRLEG